MTANGNPGPGQLDEAASIIDQRVNAKGVTEAEVTTQGNQFIVSRSPAPRPTA